MGCGASKPEPAKAGSEAAPQQKYQESPAEKPAAEKEAQKPAQTAQTAQPPPPSEQPGGQPKAVQPEPPPRVAETRPTPSAAPAPATNGEISQSKTLPERIRTEELIKLCQSSHFDRTQVEKLYELFKVISSSGDDDGLIDKAEFTRALGLKHNLFVDRMFELFDANGDQNINFQEFIAGLSCFTLRAKPVEKARFSFRMYDFNGDEQIDKDELGRMLKSTIEDNKLNITAEQAEELVNSTFLEAKTSQPDYINFDEYMALVTKKPQLLEFMTIRSLNTICN